MLTPKVYLSAGPDTRPAATDCPSGHTKNFSNYILTHKYVSHHRAAHAHPHTAKRTHTDYPDTYTTAAYSTPSTLTTYNAPLINIYHSNLAAPFKSILATSWNHQLNMASSRLLKCVSSWIQIWLLNFPIKRQNIMNITVLNNLPPTSLTLYLLPNYAV